MDNISFTIKFNDNRLLKKIVFGPFLLLWNVNFHFRGTKMLL